MKKLLTIAALLVIVSTGQAQQKESFLDDGRKVAEPLPWVSVKSSEEDKPKMRLFDSDGFPIYKERLEMMFQKDCDPNGWKYDMGEWEYLITGKHSVPAYYFDESRQQDNGGYSIG
jgi:hypothetical protein